MIRKECHTVPHVVIPESIRASTGRSPEVQNAHVERAIGSIRRECLDHVIVFNAAGLERVLADYVVYYLRSRTHLTLTKTPRSRGHANCDRPYRRDAAGRRPAPPVRSRRRISDGPAPLLVSRRGPRRGPLSGRRTPRLCDGGLSCSPVEDEQHKSLNHRCADELTSGSIRC